MNELWVCRHCKKEQEGVIEAISEKGCCVNGDCSIDGNPCDAKRFVEERVGRWIVTTYDSGNKTHECSVCHRLFTGEPVDKPYCNCGAKMEV